MFTGSNWRCLDECGRDGLAGYGNPKGPIGLGIIGRFRVTVDPLPSDLPHDRNGPHAVGRPR